jgi:molecular chaperone GrpE (heat shock protein)
MDLTRDERRAVVGVCDEWLTVQPLVDQAMAADPTLEDETWQEVVKDTEATAEQLRSFLRKAEVEEQNDNGTGSG